MITYPPNNVFQVTNDTGIPQKAIAEGYWVLLDGLKAGEHTIEFTGGASALNFTTHVTYYLTIEPKHNNNYNNNNYYNDNNEYQSYSNEYENYYNNNNNNDYDDSRDNNRDDKKDEYKMTTEIIKRTIKKTMDIKSPITTVSMMTNMDMNTLMTLANMEMNMNMY